MLIKKTVFFVTLSIGLAFSLMAYSFMICDKDVELELARKADVIVSGKVIKVEPINIYFRLATLKIEKIIKGDSLSPEIIIEFKLLDKSLEPDVQDYQLDRIGERGTAYLKKLSNNHYKILGGICGWKLLDSSK